MLNLKVMYLFRLPTFYSIYVITKCQMRLAKASDIHKITQKQS